MAAFSCSRSEDTSPPIGRSSDLVRREQRAAGQIDVTPIQSVPARVLGVARTVASATAAYSPLQGHEEAAHVSFAHADTPEGNRHPLHGTMSARVRGASPTTAGRGRMGLVKHMHPRVERPSAVAKGPGPLKPPNGPSTRRVRAHRRRAAALAPPSDVFLRRFVRPRLQQRAIGLGLSDGWRRYGARASS
jgi:hypothetical protein